MSDEKSEINNRILKEYHIEDRMHPQIILRQIVGNGVNVDGDDLCVISFDMSQPKENIELKVPENFSWAVPSLKILHNSYEKMLLEPTERVHIDGIIQNKTYIILENKKHAQQTNMKVGAEVDMSGGCGYLDNHPAIFLINGKMKSTTFLHEAIHHSDLMLQQRHFSNFPLYQTAIMIIDAQRSDSRDKNRSVYYLRLINRAYKPGQLYMEGLTWISSMSLETLSKEKNHCAKNLKILHALYTKAVLEENFAVMSCFERFKPSGTLQILLNAYNQRGQQIGKNRRQILKQEDDFINDVLLFRKDLRSILNSGLAKEKVPDSVFDVCEKCGLSRSTDIVSIYLRAKYLFDNTKNDNAKKLEILNKCRRKINSYQKSSGDLKDFLASYIYVQLIENAQSGKTLELKLTDENTATESETIQTMKDQISDGISVCEVSIQTQGSIQDCKLACGLGVQPGYVKAARQIVGRDFDKTENLTEKMRLISAWINDFETKKLISEKTKAQVKAAIGMEKLLDKAFGDSYLHGALGKQDLKNFNISKTILRDLAYMETDTEKDGLPIDLYKDFDLGLISDLCSRKSACFDEKSPEYKPNDYRGHSKKSTLYAHALYEFLAVRHQADVTTLPELELTCFNPNSSVKSWYRKSALTHIAKSIRNLADGR